MSQPPTTTMTTPTTAIDPYASTRNGIPDPWDKKVCSPSLFRQVLVVSEQRDPSNADQRRPGAMNDCKRLVMKRLDELQSGNYPNRALKGDDDGTFEIPALSEQIKMLRRIVAAFDDMKNQDPFDELTELDLPGNQLTDAQYNEIVQNPSTTDPAPISTSSGSHGIDTDTATDSAAAVSSGGRDPRYTDDEVAFYSEMRVAAGYTPLDLVTGEPLPSN